MQQRMAVAIAAAVSATLIAVVVFGSRGLLHFRSLTVEEHEVGRRIGMLLYENECLRDRIKRLRTDDRALERLAREQLGFTRPDEVIYRFGNRPQGGTDGPP
jgi:cell division protein FtsB